MKKYTILLLILAGLVACDNELDLIEDWKDIPIVYGVLDPSDTAHYIRVEKAFIDAQVSGLDIAKVADSLYYEDVEVILTRGGTDYTLEKVDGNLEGYPREEGIFATAPNYLYKIKADALNLTGDEELKLSIVRQGGLDVVESTMRTIGEYAFLRPRPEDPEKINLSYANHLTIRWDAAPNAVDYTVYVIAHYREKEKGAPEDTYIDKEVTWKAASGVEGRSVMLESRNFFTFLAASIEEDENVDRDFVNLEFRVLAVGEELSDYIEIGGVNLGITASQEIPQYSNLSEGKGVFSSKYEIRLPGLRVIDATRDSIENGVFTRHLNFQ
jgi:hypothetical protein